MVEQLWQVYGPIVLSAGTFFCSFCILEPLALLLGPSFNLLANRSIGKFAFMGMALYQLALFLLICPALVQKRCIAAACFFYEASWLRKLSLFFVLGLGSHLLFLLSFHYTGYIAISWPTSTLPSLSIGLRLLLGLGVTLLLAWSEELIFRGLLYNYFNYFFSQASAIIVSSLLFMAVHDLRAPWQLITKNWRLGVGLFLLGVILNQIYCITRSISASIGTHMGLVMVKVFLRRVPLVTYDSLQYDYWFARDIRQAGMVHIALIVLIVFLTLILYKKKLHSLKTIPNPVQQS